MTLLAPLLLSLLLSIPSHRVALGDSLERRRTIDAGIECLFVQEAFIPSSSGKLSLLFFDVFKRDSLKRIFTII
jgi:hypothetical protein